MPDVAAGDIITAAYLRNLTNAGAVGVQYEVPTAGTTNSTSYTATLTGSTAAGGTFVGPPSGVVMVLWAAGMFLDAAGGTGRVSWEVRLGSTVGSGTVVLGADDGRALRLKTATTTNHDQQWGTPYRLSGLAWGQTYNIRHMFKESDTATLLHVLNQRLIVVPSV